MASLSRFEPAQQAYQEAIVAYDQALTLAPDYINALNNKGNCLLSLSQTQVEPSQEVSGNLMNALTVFTRSLELAPENEQIRNLRNILLKELEQISQEKE